MPSENKKQIKTRLHPRNKNRKPYDLNALIITIPELKNYIKPNKFGADSVDFSNPIAVKLLNKGLLHHYYGIENWDFPDENLCPPIPGRADYIHHVADLLAENLDSIPLGGKITCLDVGVGANCIYPIIGITEYDWRFIGSDIDSKSIASAKQIVDSNPSLKGKIECRLQKDSRAIFKDILESQEKIDVTICNPPFHSSHEDAQKGTQRKLKNLTGKKVKSPKLNFAGNTNELVYEGGEYQFIKNMVRESKNFSKNCYWFSTLVSKQSNLKKIYSLLENSDVILVKTIPMGTGNKSTRIVAWTFLSLAEQKVWTETRWKI